MKRSQVARRAFLSACLAIAPPLALSVASADDGGAACPQCPAEKSNSYVYPYEDYGYGPYAYDYEDCDYECFYNDMTPVVEAPVEAPPQETAVETDDYPYDGYSEEAAQYDADDHEYEYGWYEDEGLYWSEDDDGITCPDSCRPRNRTRYAVAALH